MTARGKTIVMSDIFFADPATRLDDVFFTTSERINHHFFLKQTIRVVSKILVRLAPLSLGALGAKASLSSHVIQWRPTNL